MTPTRVDLLSNASATGSSKQWPGGRGQFAVEGTIGGATITLQVQGPNGTWLAVGTDAALTAAGVVNFDLPQCNIRALVASGSPSALYATAVSIPA